MRLIQTDSLVLHTFNYRETSRIVRLATESAGVVSAIARGARRPRSRFSAALDLFSSGVAHLTMHPTRDLHALTAFDVTRARGALAGSLERFGAASAIAELFLRFAREDGGGRLLGSLVTLLDAVGRAGPADVPGLTLAGAWRVVAELGFGPALDSCASCDAAVSPGGAVTFHHRAGGALCMRCARNARGGRRLPADARAALSAWLGGDPGAPVAGAAVRAHQRLLREFLEEHLGDGRPLRAFVAWEVGNGRRGKVARA